VSATKENLRCKRKAGCNANRKSSAESLFTLTELIVVIAIFTVIVGMLLPVLKAASEVAKASICMNNLKQNGLAFMAYAKDNNDYVVLTDDNYSWATFYDALEKPSVNPNTSCLIHLGYIKENTQFRCDMAPPNEVYPDFNYKGKIINGSGAVYGIPTRNIIPEVAYVEVKAGPQVNGFIRFINLPKLKEPSRIMGLTDSINNEGHQDGKVSPTVANFTLGRHHLRHNGFANTWFFDGHAGPIDIAGVADLVKAAGQLPVGTAVYAQSENSTTVTGTVK
jgi:prepilin-type processing-associated H-X9-DG protein